MSIFNPGNIMFDFGPPKEKCSVCKRDLDVCECEDGPEKYFDEDKLREQAADRDAFNKDPDYYK